MPVSYEEHVDQLTNKLNGAIPRLKRSNAYYDSKYRLESIGIGTPPEMRKLNVAIGWPRMYLDSIEERLDVETFRLSGKADPIERLTDWWKYNRLDEESSLGHLEALIYGRSYITVSAPGEGDHPDNPLIRVESPLNLYAEVDPRTQKVKRALRRYKGPAGSLDEYATLLLPDDTIQLRRSSGAMSRWTVESRVNHKLGRVLVVPLLNRERLSERDGRSEITPEIRSMTDAASRVMMNLQSAAELMAVPQRVIFGADAESIAGTGSQREILDAYYARIIAIENEAGKATQFTAADLRNFVEGLEQIAKHVASYTGLPPQYLAFASDNPASAEAIRSAEARLVKKAERRARMFGGSWEEVMRLAVLVMDGKIPDDYYRLETVWRDPSTPTFAAKADAVSKLYNSGNGIIPKERARMDLGYSAEERAEMAKQDDAEPVARLNALVGAPIPGQPRPPATPPPNPAAKDAAAQAAA